ncbi:MAG: dihydrolipoyllysine-residue acetyltransferase [Pseudomonadota bacterium]|nr:dihydrolipoyllysine-residue acetyltransferase [Pseudomonadota bacterium]
MAVVEVKVPDIGDFKEVEVIELLVKAGDTIKAEQSLVTVESDKASMEIPSSHAGVVKELKVKLGDKVAEGSLLLMLEEPGSAGEAKAPAPAPKAAPAPAPTKAEAPAAASASAAKGGASQDVVVPDIGDFDEVAVIEVLVKEGDTVAVEQSLITVESDKASMEIPSSAAGTVEKLLVKIGDKVAKGTPIVKLKGAAAVASSAPAPKAETNGEAMASAAAPAPAGAAPSPQYTPPPAPTTSAVEATAAHEPGAATGKLPHASPSIRRLAREMGVPLAEVKGSGAKGRITQEDLHGFIKGVMAGSVQTAAQKTKAPTAAAGGGAGLPGLMAWPQVDFTKFGEVERKELGRIKKISGAALHRNWVMIPHVTNHDDADITELEAFRVQLNKENEKAGIKVTMLAFLIKAAVAALKKFPEFNASLDGETLVLKKYVHIGFAADTPNGLMVPVIKNADKKGVLQISQEMNELAKKARDGKLGPAEMTGGCFSISSLGGIGGRYFSPIINAPEVAILGVSKSSMQPIWDGKQFSPRLMLPMSLSWDHRVIDGASAARFNAYLGAILADFRRVLL